MRRLAIINQKGGVGKTTTCANLGAALARAGRRVVLVDLDPQANLTLYMGAEPAVDDPTVYSLLTGDAAFEDVLQPTATENLSLVTSHIDLSGAELELASAIGRETILRQAVDDWEQRGRERDGRAPADYLIFDCAPSLGLLSINALAAAREVLITLQTEFFALQGMSKLVEVIRLLQKRMNPQLEICGIVPCLYDSRLKLAREVLAEIRTYFPDKVFPNPIRTNVKLAESPSYGQTIFEYAPDSNGARDHMLLAAAVMAQEERDPERTELPRDPELAELSREPDVELTPTAPPAGASDKAAAPPAAEIPEPEPRTPGADPEGSHEIPEAPPATAAAETPTEAGVQNPVGTPVGEDGR